QAAGILEVAELRFGAGTGRLVLNHTESRYVLAPAIIGNGTVRVENGTTVLAGSMMRPGGTCPNRTEPADRRSRAGAALALSEKPCPRNSATVRWRISVLGPVACGAGHSMKI
ncbi:hypothetical protein ABTE42_20080, partial [Acinetobacter baumannii]